jgi:hypothetical protein
MAKELQVFPGNITNGKAYGFFHVGQRYFAPQQKN